MLLLERDPLVLGDARESSSTPLGPRRATLKLWVAVVALVHFDRGAATVAAMGITDWSSDNDSFGYAVSLLAWHSVGLAIGNSLAGTLFQQVSAKALLLCSLSTTMLCALLLGLQQQPGIVSSAVLRLGSGLAAALPLVYLPLWVDEFSFSGSHGHWMSVVQAGAPLGQFFGILAAAGAEEAHSGWRFALLAQAAMLLPVILRIATVPLAQVDVANLTLSARLDSLSLHSDGSWLQGIVRELREMLQGMNRNPLTMSLSSTLCLLHATAAALALWAAPYLALSMGAPSGLATIVLSALVLSSLPALGTYIGAVVCDRVDGFKAGMHAAALRVACGFVALGAACGPLNSAADGFLPRFLLVSCWLFSIGALLPICAGLLMTSMPSYLRSFSAASMFLVLHIMSFSVAPALIALLMSCFVRPEKGLNFGMNLSLWATTPAAVLLLFAYAREPKGSGPSSLSGVDDLTFSDVSYELARRRMSTAPL